MKYNKPQNADKTTRTRRADVFAGAGSVAGNLKRERTRTESMADIDAMIDGNSTDVVVKRGYMREDE